MSKKLRGSYYVDGQRSLTLTTSDDDKLVDVGFRLVSGSGVGINRGNSWDFWPEFARVNRTDIDDMSEIAPLISFRLARENT